MRDDSDEGYDRRPTRNSNSTLWIVLGVVGGLFLTGILVCGGLFYFGFRAAKDVVGSMVSATGSAENFMDQLQAGNTAAAYQLTSPGYQSRTTQAQFDQFLAQNPGLLNHTGRNSNSFNMTTVNGVTKYVAKFAVTGLNAGVTCTLTLVEQNGTWVVDSITVP